MKKAIASLIACSVAGLAAQAQAHECAHMYQHANYGGEVRVVEIGANISNIGSLWNDQISSVIVHSGCVLNVWQHADFGGAHETWQGNIPYVGDWWNDQITAYTCTCS
ncbi:peptidase inhibitor family I36 protein [Polyangium aurulentum]|uniref:peptidase inhibitor family I36 protein n=1 Tax=Polyangium aurulentum TaxID=2567896 RepID=UPI0010AEB997|nr:peptidase inhibitor family I36 protein [Polyangium aurulentum]UQA54767.1 peptidase inhibitor family I36 protein [Polyangium aurulentum]